jgi:hypothetical protein
MDRFDSVQQCVPAKSTKEFLLHLRSEAGPSPDPSYLDVTITPSAFRNRLDKEDTIRMRATFLP